MRRAAVAASARLFSPRAAHRREPDEQGPQRTGRAAAEHQRPHEQPDVHDQVPRDEREHGRREQVDARAAADAVDEHAEHERAEHGHDAHPRPPPDAAHRARHGGLARADPLEHELRAPPEELLGARPLPHDGRRRAAGPLAVGVGPQHPIAVGRLDGARRGRVEGGRLVHIAESMPPPRRVGATKCGLDQIHVSFGANRNAASMRQILSIILWGPVFGVLATLEV